MPGWFCEHRLQQARVHIDKWCLKQMQRERRDLLLINAVGLIAMVAYGVVVAAFSLEEAGPITTLRET